MPAGAETDAHALALQPVSGAHQVVDAQHLVIDMLHAGTRGGEQGDAVVHPVDAQQRCGADAVADAGAQGLVWSRGPPSK